MKLTLAILGMSPAGSALATRLANQPYRLLLFDQDSQRAQTLADLLLSANPLADLEAIDCQVNASWEADIIVLAVSEPGQHQLTERIREVATCKLVIGLTSMPIPNDQSGFAPALADNGLQRQLPNSKVVTALSHDEQSETVLIGTDAKALLAASALVRAAGWGPVVVEDWCVNDSLDSLPASGFKVSSTHGTQTVSKNPCNGCNYYEQFSRL